MANNQSKKQSNQFGFLLVEALIALGPGKYKTKNFAPEILPPNLEVDQEDLRPTVLWGTNTPKKYSYYSWDSATEKIVLPTSQRGIISYGNIGKDAVTGVHGPAHYNSNGPTDNDKYCQNLDPLAVCTNCTPDLVVDANVIINCSTGPISKEANFINATRSGQRVGLLQQNSVATGSTKAAFSKILPMNFDFEAFQQALATCAPEDSPGELGCIFRSGGLAGRPFNGIIFVTNQWMTPGVSYPPM